MLYQAQRTVHSIGRHLARAMHTGARVAHQVDHGIQRYGLPVYQHVVRPLMEHKGIDTSRLDHGLKTYEGLRRAIK